MSGTQQPQNYISFRVFNGLAPASLCRSMPVSLDFTIATQIGIDLTIAGLEDRLEFVQGVYIDNSLNPTPLTLTVSKSQQTVNCPAYSQGTFPIFSPNPPQFVASLPLVAAGNTNTIIQFLNFPVPLAIWAQSILNIDFPSVLTLAAPGNVTINSADINNFDCVGGKFGVNITGNGGAGSVTIHIQGKDVASGTYYDILVSAALAANAFTLLTVYPGLVAAANVTVNDILPRTFRVQAVIAGGFAPVGTIGCSLVD